jgi:hypothetical protein
MVERQRILSEVLRKRVFYRIALETVGNWWNSHVVSGTDVSGFYVRFLPFPAGKYRKWSEVAGIILWFSDPGYSMQVPSISSIFLTKNGFRFFVSDGIPLEYGGVPREIRVIFGVVPEWFRAVALSGTARIRYGAFRPGILLPSCVCFSSGFRSEMRGNLRELTGTSPDSDRFRRAESSAWVALWPVSENFTFEKWLHISFV